MTTAVTTAMNFLGNALDSILQDPKGGQHPDLAVGAAFDVVKNTPIDMYSSIPHYETEVGNSEPANSSGSPAGATGV
jgi:hypothetical protein